MSEPDRPSTVPRRRFLQWFGLGGLWGALGGGLAHAQAPAAAAKPQPSAGAARDTTATAPAAPEPPSEQARTLARLVRERYPKAIQESDLERIARDLEGDLRAGARLRAAKLTNADEPDFTFRA